MICPPLEVIDNILLYSDYCVLNQMRLVNTKLVVIVNKYLLVKWKDKFYKKKISNIETVCHNGGYFLKITTIKNKKHIIYKCLTCDKKVGKRSISINNHHCNNLCGTCFLPKSLKIHNSYYRRSDDGKCPFELKTCSICKNVTLPYYQLLHHQNHHVNLFRNYRFI